MQDWVCFTTLQLKPRAAPAWFGHENRSSGTIAQQSVRSDNRRQRLAVQNKKLKIIGENDRGDTFELSADDQKTYIKLHDLVDSTPGSLLLCRFKWHWFGNACTQLWGEWDRGKFRINADGICGFERLYTVIGGEKQINLSQESLEESWAGRILLITWKGESRFKIVAYIVRDIYRWCCNLVPSTAWSYRMFGTLFPRLHGAIECSELDKAGIALLQRTLCQLIELTLYSDPNLNPTLKSCEIIMSFNSEVVDDVLNAEVFTLRKLKVPTEPKPDDIKEGWVLREARRRTKQFKCESCNKTYEKVKGSGSNKEGDAKFTNCDCPSP